MDYTKEEVESLFMNYNDLIKNFSMEKFINYNNECLLDKTNWNKLDTDEKNYLHFYAFEELNSFCENKEDIVKDWDIYSFLAFLSGVYQKILYKKLCFFLEIEEKPIVDLINNNIRT